MTKSLDQIRHKSHSFKRRLENEKITENFGGKEERELEKFVGDIYEYSYYARLEIIKILNEFSEWCCNKD